MLSRYVHSYLHDNYFRTNERRRNSVSPWRRPRDTSRDSRIRGKSDNGEEIPPRLTANRGIATFHCVLLSPHLHVTCYYIFTSLYILSGNLIPTDYASNSLPLGAFRDNAVRLKICELIPAEVCVYVCVCARAYWRQRRDFYSSSRAAPS